MRIHQLSPVALLLIAGATLSAQEVTGTLTGTVRSQDGQPLAGTSIRVTSTKTITTRVVQTDAAGNFRMPFLLPGDYTAVVSKDGWIGSKAEFRVSGGQTMRQDFVMRPMQTAGAVVEVVSVSATIDKTQTKTATSMTLDDIVAIPTAGNFAVKSLAALVMTPAVSGANSLYAAVRGGAQGQTQYLVNGLSVRDNITSQGRPHDVILDDLVEESQIILSPLNAKYGDSSAGLINLVEKTGSNEFSGTLRAKLDRPIWTARRPVGVNYLGQPNTSGREPAFNDALTRIYELSFSGPIIKDRLTFTYGTRLQPVAPVTRNGGALGTSTFTYFNNAAVAAQVYDQNATRNIGEKFTFNQGRLYWRITDDHSLDYSHAENFNQYADWGATGNTTSVDLSLPPNQTSTTKFRQITYRGIFGGNQTIEARYGAREGSIQFVSGPGDPITLRWGPAGMTSLRGTNSTFTVNGGNADELPEKRNTYSGLINYNAYFEWHGQHNLDAGINWIKTEWGTVQNSGGPNGRVFFIPGQVNTGSRDTGFVVFNWNSTIHNYYTNSADRAYIPTMVEYGGIPAADLNKPVTSLYLNDQWTINDHWSVMAGVRYEKYKYEDGGGVKYDSSSLSPRFEVKYDFEGNNRRVLGFSYAQFRGNVHERITRGFSEFRRTTVVTRFWNASPDGNMQQVSKSDILNPANYGYYYDFQVPSAVFAIDKGFKPDVSHQLELQYARAYDSGGSLKTSLVYRTWKDLPMSFGDPSLLTIPDPTGQGLPAKTNYLRTLAVDPDSKRNYMGLEVDFKVPLIKNTLFLQGVYTYSRTTGTLQLQDSTGWNSGLANAGWFRDQYLAMGIPRDAFDPEGQMPSSANNSVRMMLLYVSKLGAARTTLSFLGRYNDGAPEDRTANSVRLPQPLNAAVAQLPTSYTQYWNGRGQYTQPDFLSFDLAYNLDIPVTKKVTFFSTLAVSNLFNTIRKTTSYWSNSSTVQAPYPGLGYRINTGVSAFYGMPLHYTYYQTGRDFNLDLGLRF